MKNYLSGSILSLGLVLGISQAAQAKLNVFACFPEWQALVSELGGDSVEIFTAISALKNPDNVDVTPVLISALKNADLLVCTGADFEGEWLPGALKRAQNPKLAGGQPGLFFARDFVEGLEDDHTKGEEKGEGHLHEHGNPYVQGDPYRIRAVAGRLGQRMIQIDPAAAEVYKKNTRDFIRDLGALAKDLEKKAAPLRGINIVAQHEHSVYLLNWLGVESAAIVEPNVGVPPGPGDLAKIVSLIPRANVKFAVHAAYENPRPTVFVAGKTGIPVINLPFTVGGTPDATTYADFYTSSVQRMLDGLNGTSRP
ncbi:MAG: zinc ABC transporter substrate-binding protein [Rhodospirillales bacterium]|nr:zinc ABC transporter substrate-binding protein [Rhodospirillales bacterium]